MNDLMTGKRKIIIDLAIITLAVLILTMPFINQAVHLDDQEFLDFARVQLEHPLQFYLEDHGHNGTYWDVFRTSHPPLMSSYYAAVMWLTGGEAERDFHLADLLFSLIGAFSMYSLGKKFCRHPLSAALLLVVSSGFVVMSHSLRGDLPGLAFWLAATASYVWGLDRSSRKLLALSALFLFLAVMTAYQSLSLIPLLFLYALLRRRVGLAALLSLAAPAAGFAGYYFFLRATAGGGPPMAYTIGISFGWERLDLKLRALVVFVGGMIVFPLALIPASLAKRADLAPATLLSAAAMLVGVLIPLGYGSLTVIQAVLLAPMLVAGVILFYRVVREVAGGAAGWWSGKGTGAGGLFLGVWLLGISFYVMIFLPYVSVRYLLPLSAPLILIFIRCADGLFGRHKALFHSFLGVTLALGLAVSLAAAVADYRLAGSFRDMAERFSARYEGRQGDIWFLGEFGFRYYMEREGFRYLSVNSIAQPGDLVIRSEEAAGVYPNIIIPPPPGEYSFVVDTITVDDSFPIRIRNPWAGAGFYSHRGGPVPLMPSRERLDRYTIYQLDW